MWGIYPSLWALDVVLPALRRTYAANDGPQPVDEYAPRPEPASTSSICPPEIPAKR